ncbi:hypothetical protein ACFHWD_09195 [Clostridium sp. MT-14]|jgi:hypothetical protein|uniref:hypothetical protein n=1 Tax=unclassified Clostridium TaxID=2614128 RepID=UPI0012399333|nr:hypothetical protein [Clostridium sp. HV4-5-A1G]KAA8676372.1 hypothetical protein F3O63_03420 [Clostridium sp. HV4-5-A1G]CAB1248197.1 ABC-2 family transporter protein [Clostridiaceae bacterium BL-3]
MFKFVKYDLQGCFKDFIIMICTIIILNILLFTRINTWTWEPQLIVFLNLAINFAAGIVVIIWNIRLFSRDIYEDTAYLVFTTPKSGVNILMNKIITAILQCLIISFFSLAFTAILIQILKLTPGFALYTGISFSQIFSAVTLQFIVYSILILVIVYISFLLTVYLSLALGRVAIKNRKLGKIGTFGIFIVLCIIQAKIENLFSSVFPQGFMLRIFNFDNGEPLIKSTVNTFTNPSNIFSSGVVNLNVAETAVSLIFIAAMFYATAYLIENKLDL